MKGWSDMKKLLAFLFMIIMFIPVTNITAAEKVKLDSTNFPDEKFRDLVKEKFDKNNDGYLGSTEIKNARTLSGVGRDIKSAEGIKYLPNLYYLNLRNNPLETLDLKYNTKMKEIDIIGTKLTSIKNIKYLTKLETIKVSQTWLYNQNFINIKSPSLEITCKEPFYLTSNYYNYIYWNIINRNFDGGTIINSIDGQDYVSRYINNHKTVIRINIVTKRLNYFSKFDIKQKTINSIELNFPVPTIDKDDLFDEINPKYYEILRSTSKNGTFKRIKLTTKNKFVHTGLTPYKTYYYKIRAYRKQSNGLKIYSNEADPQEFKTEITKLCVEHKRANCDCCYEWHYWKEEKLDSYSNGESIKISWINHKDADGYEFGYMKDVNTCGEAVCYNYSHKSKVFTVIKRTTSGSVKYDPKKYGYDVGVRAYRYVGGKKQYTWIMPV